MEFTERSLTAPPRTKPRTGKIRFTPQDTSNVAVSYRLLLLFLLLLYSNVGLPSADLGPFGLAQAAAGAALFVLLAEKVLARQGLDLVWPESHLLVAFLWTSGLSCFNSAWPRLSFESTLNIAKFAIVYMLIVNVVTSPRRLRGILLTMVLGGLIPTIVALHHYASGILYEGRVHLHGPFGNPNDLAYSLVILVPLAAVVAHEFRGVWRPLIWAIGIAYLGAIYVTYSRGGMLGLFVVLAMLGWRQRIPAVRMLTAAMLLVSLVFVGYFWSRAEGFVDLSSDVTVNERLISIRSGIAMFFDRPLLGVGIGGSIAAFRNYVPSDIYFGRELIIHNTLVQVLGETGAIGALFYVLLLATGLYDARKIAKSPPARGGEETARLAGGLEIALWGFLVCSVWGGYVLSWFPYILIGLVATAKKLDQREFTL